MAKFDKGNSGRPKGSLNKKSTAVKQRIEWVLDLLEESLEESIQKMRPTEKVRLWAELQEYVRPKLQRVNLEVGVEDKAITKIVFEIVPPGLPGEGIETKPE